MTAASRPSQPIGILDEHPTWSNRLIAQDDPDFRAPEDDGMAAATELYAYANELAVRRRDQAAHHRPAPHRACRRHPRVGPHCGASHRLRTCRQRLPAGTVERYAGRRCHLTLGEV